MKTVEKPSFFISVAAFCDPDLIFTVKNAVEHAKYPDRLNFGIIEQSVISSCAALKEYIKPAKMSYTHVDPIQSRGASWARSLAFALYQGEDLLLQIDSHTLFDPGWDVKLTEYMNKLRDWSARPIITTYPWGFKFNENKEPQKLEGDDTSKTLVLLPKPDLKLSLDDARLYFRAVPVNNPNHTPLPAIHIAGGFLLSDGIFVEHVPYDPLLYFHGEEQSLFIRAYTKGWDAFHMPSVPLFHLYKSPNSPTPSLHWDQEWDKKRDFSYADLERKSKNRLADLLYQRRDLGVFGLGSERTLQDYANLSGIDYTNRIVGTSNHSNLGINVS